MTSAKAKELQHLPVPSLRVSGPRTTVRRHCDCTANLAPHITIQTYLPTYNDAPQLKLPTIAFGKLQLFSIPRYHHNTRVRSVASCQLIPFRSALSSDYAVPRLRTKLGERAFSHAGPSAWNACTAARRTFMPHQTLLFLEDNSKLIILASF